MNTTEFKVEMLRHNDTNFTLAKKLNISEVSVCHKIQGKTPWKKDEMESIRDDYGFSVDRFMEIFFPEEVS